MVKQLCHDITSDDQNNYSPGMFIVPIIGMYITGASMVCSLFLIYDVVHGIRRRKYWLPCRWFSFNSVTLILLSIAAKLPVDLTTPMPRAWDQLAKLTGTTFICVCMGYLVPSLAANTASECTTNMAALSIFVITVIVNICIQISTGVIFTYIPQHIIIMLLMLAMLTFLWGCTWATNMDKEIKSDRNKQVFIQGRGSVTMVQRLKLCYMHGYSSDPQLLLGKDSFSTIPDSICLFCLVVVMQVLARTISDNDLRSCRPISPYGQLMTLMIVASQIFFILLASLMAIFRMFSVGSEQISVCGFNVYPIWGHDDPDGATGNKPYLDILLQIVDENFISLSLKSMVCVGLGIALFVFALPLLAIICIFKIAGSCFNRKHIQPEGIQECIEPEGIQEYIELKRQNDMVIAHWALTNCVGDIQRLMSEVKAEKDPLCHLPQLLSETPPSSRSLEELYNSYNFEGREVTCLYLVFLVRYASVFRPRYLSCHLAPSLNEVFDIICFIETKINPPSFSSRKKLRRAKAMWMARVSASPTSTGLAVSESIPPAISCKLDCTRFVIDQLKTLFPSCFKWKEVSCVMDFINGLECKSDVERCACMKQLFVDMLHIFLMQLPQAICKEVTESPVEEYTKTVERMLKFISRIESLEGKVEWSFPIGSNITNLIHTLASPTDNHGSARRGNGNNSNVDAAGSNDDCNVVNNTHEINEV